MAACHFCGAEGARLNANHWDGAAYHRVDVCLTGECRSRLASAPKRPRAPRRAKRAPVLYGDFAQLAAFNGMLRKDGTARTRRGVD